MEATPQVLDFPVRCQRTPRISPNLSERKQVDQAPGNQRHLQDLELRRQKGMIVFSCALSRPGTLHLSETVTDIRIAPSPLNLTLREKESRRDKERIPTQQSIYSNYRLRKKAWMCLNLSQIGKIPSSANGEKERREKL